MHYKVTIEFDNADDQLNEGILESEIRAGLVHAGNPTSTPVVTVETTVEATPIGAVPPTPFRH